MPANRKTQIVDERAVAVSRMSGRRSSGNRKKKGEDEGEVEELLRAAEDEMVLKLSIDSHMSRVAPSYIDPDLDRRFQSLKSRPTNTINQPRQEPPSIQQPTISTSTNTHQEDYYEEPKADDLFARFAALKASLPSNSSSSSSSPSLNNHKVNSNIADSHDLLLPPSRFTGREQKQNDDDIDEDEVQKLIKWAIDAARLDPSPPSDTDDDTDDDSEDSDDESDRTKTGKQK